MAAELQEKLESMSLAPQAPKKEDKEEKEDALSMATKKFSTGEVVSASVTKDMGKIKFRLPDFMKPDAPIPEHVSKLIGEKVILPWWKEDTYCVVIRDVFTKEECDDLIKMTEEVGYGDALINIGYGRMQKMDDVRNNSRLMIDSWDMVDTIYKRIKRFIPAVWASREIISLNERLRFLRYTKGQYFAPHFDGEYRRENGERSYITMLFYLNEGFVGGTTNFLSFHKKQWEMPITTGSVLLFQHDLYHEGALLKEGLKYCVRSDVMYSRYQLKPAVAQKMKKQWQKEFDKSVGVSRHVGVPRKPEDDPYRE